MIAAAATSGVVLMGVPLLLSQLGGGTGSGPGSVPPRPTGYSQADGGPGGFVPRADAPEKGSALPGTPAPGATNAPGKTSPVAGKGPLATSVAGIGAGVGAGQAGRGVGGRSAAGASSRGQGCGRGAVGCGTATQPAVRSTDSRRNVVRRGCMAITLPDPAGAGGRLRLGPPSRVNLVTAGCREADGSARVHRHG
ncbi:hypothetical protein [Streptomyces venezuelae]|uniref:hypothetical protein n=1 Tax=Streptomyces venezuelae TaxID=54571 RepID=UPI00278C54AE|nr:hypothetical protein [Streptomyces venezuelae]